MDIGIISNRYAKTLLRFATENKEENLVYSEMATLSESFSNVPELYKTLLNPTLSREAKEKLLARACAGKAEPSKTISKFFQLITRNKRSDLMIFIAHAYLDIYHKSKNMTQGRLIVPVEVDSTTEQKLQKMVEDRSSSKVEFKTEVDPAIEGGFILEYDTYRLDASLKTQLQALRRALN